MERIRPPQMDPCWLQLSVQAAERHMAGLVLEAVLEQARNLQPYTLKERRYHEPEADSETGIPEEDSHNHDTSTLVAKEPEGILVLLEDAMGQDKLLEVAPHTRDRLDTAHSLVDKPNLELPRHTEASGSLEVVPRIQAGFAAQAVHQLVALMPAGQ